MAALDWGAAGGGAADALQQIIAQKLREQMARAQMEDLARSRDLQARGQDITARGQQMTQDRWSTDRSDALASTAKAEAAAAAQQAEQQAALDNLVQTQPQLARFVLAQKGGLVGKLTTLPATPEEEAAKVAAARNAKTFDTDEEIRQARATAGLNRGNERLVQVEGPDGRATWVRESEAAGKPAAQAARAVTGAERGVLAYYNRAKDAEGTISAPDASGRTLEDRVAKGGIGTQLGLQYAPNILQSSDQQAYRQAQRAFTEARLRKESGAAIPTSEYENDAKTYFAQPGDRPEVIEQKRLKRQTVLEGLKFSSGRAYDEFYGEQNKPQDRNRPRGNVTIKSITEIK